MVISDVINIRWYSEHKFGRVFFIYFSEKLFFGLIPIRPLIAGWKTTYFISDAHLEWNSFELLENGFYPQYQRHQIEDEHTQYMHSVMIYI